MKIFNLSKSKLLLTGCLVFIIGIAIASFLPLEILKNDLGWFVVIIFWAAVLILFWNNKKMRLTALIGLFLFLAVWRYAIGLPADTPDKIWHYNSRELTVIGVVNKEPDRRRKNVKYEVKVRQIRKDKARFYDNISGNILLTTNLYPSYNYGDELEIICELQETEEFNGFAYDRYLARYDIYSVCYYPEIKLLSTGGGDWLYKKVFVFKDKLRAAINIGLGEPAGGLARAIILGDKKGIDLTLREKFSQTGLSHIVAISGLHISIFGALIMSLLLGIGLWRKQAFYVACLLLILYIILIGAPASSMRAGAMGFLVMLALNQGRLNRITNSVMLVAAILLFINPKLLRDDIGFQLSFLAVLGIVYFYPILNGFFKYLKIPKLGGIRDVVIITLSAQVLTLPIIAYNFSQVSLIAPLANLLVLWALPAVMIAVLAALLLSLAWSEFAFLFFLPAGLLLEYIVAVADWLAKLPYAYINIEYLHPIWLLAYYSVFLFFMVKYKYNYKIKLL